MKIGIPRVTRERELHQLSADITIDTSGLECPETMWFAMHGSDPLFQAGRADAFLLALITVAMKLDEPIRVEAPVSARLAFGLERYQKILNTWWPRTFRRVEVHYEALDARQGETRAAGVGCTFSGGLDSFYAVTEMLPANLDNETFNITHGLMINGFDQLMDLDHQDMAPRMFGTYQPVLASWNVDLLMLDTNVQQFRSAALSRAESVASFSSSLCASAHAMSGLFGRFGLSSHAGFSYVELKPGGTHAAADHHLGSDQLEIFLAGAGVSRANKLERLADNPLVQENLRVCFHPPKFDPQTGKVLNCGECEKCVRTIVNLLILDKLDDFSSFSGHRAVRDYLHPEILASIPEMFLQDMTELAQRRGRKDWLNLLEQAWRISQSAKGKSEQ
jgi:hypothetical protein